nr:MAG TPA: hypothetical protein [Caudoviricetes sp.]DAS78952.1 MAG TPA: hypothetical protein [Caudoviricetes sp.]
MLLECTATIPLYIMPCFLLRGRDSFSPVPFYGKHIVNH